MVPSTMRKVRSTEGRPGDMLHVVIDGNAWTALKLSACEPTRSNLVIHLNEQRMLCMKQWDPVHFNDRAFNEGDPVALLRASDG